MTIAVDLDVKQQNKQINMSLGHLCYLCLVNFMLSCLFIAALWSPEGKGLKCLLLFVMFIVIFVTFPFGILGQVWYLIGSIPDPCCVF